MEIDDGEEYDCQRTGGVDRSWRHQAGEGEVWVWKSQIFHTAESSIRRSQHDAFEEKISLEANRSGLRRLSF